VGPSPQFGQGPHQDHLLAADLDQVLVQTEDLWEEFRRQRLFVTGGTGFLGCWLLESFIWANQELALGASVAVLTRSTAAFRKRFPYLADHPSVELLEGDVRSFEFPSGQYSHVIHAATEAPTKDLDDKPLLKFDTMVQGTQRVLEFACQSGARKVLLTSSGAVYGKQPPDLTHMAETYLGAPEATNSRWVNGEGKRASEMLCALYAAQYGLESKIARCFAFVGPYLQLDFHYAIGSFIRNALQGQQIRADGDGAPYRSYLYAADLATWLWTILVRGKSCRAYNVGSEKSVTISELATLVSRAVSPNVGVEISRPRATNGPAERYVPSTKRAQVELGLHESTDLPQAISQTINWYLAQDLRQ
jgi:dTDP-glucose 4,6-dehydratase